MMKWRIRWVGHVAYVGGSRNAYSVLENLKVRYQFKELGVDVGRIVLKLFLKSEISSSHGGEYDVQSCLLGCTAV
jgi:hypothetical protein